MQSLRLLMTGALVGCTLLAAGCDDDSTTSPTTTASQGGNAGSGGSAGQGQGAGGAGGTTSQGGQGGGSGGQGGAGGQGGYSAELALGQLGLSCMPSVPPDPLQGSFAATYYNNTANDITFTITGARAVLADGTDTLTWSFTVTPDEVTLPSTGLSAFHDKDADSGQGTGPGAPCDYCGGTLTLEVDWLVEGHALSDSLEPISGFCAF